MLVYQLVAVAIATSVGANAPKQPTVVWTADIKAQCGITIAPVELEGVAIFGANDGLVRGVDAEKGSALWEVAASKGAPCVPPSCGVQSVPTVISGRVVLFGTNDGSLIAFDKRQNGTRLWSFATGGAVFGVRPARTQLPSLHRPYL